MSVLLQQGGPAAVQLRQDRIVGRQPGFGQSNGLPAHNTPSTDTDQSVKSIGSTHNRTCDDINASVAVSHLDVPQMNE